MSLYTFSRSKAISPISYIKTITNRHKSVYLIERNNLSPRSAVHVQLDALNDIAYDTNMQTMRVVIDTNILYAGLYSSSGASFQLLRLIRAGQVTPCISVTLAMEYEAVLSAKLEELDLTKEQLSGFLGFFVAQAERVKVFYLWRPGLRDPGNDMVLETAVAAGVDYLITHYVKDFTGTDSFGIRVVTPGWFIHHFGGTP